MTERSWLSFHFAANEIEQRLGVSGGMAMRMLRDACVSGDVRSQRQPFNPATGIDEGPPEPIKPSDWTNTQLDLECDVDGCRYFVDVDEPDFRYWLDKQGSPQKLKIVRPSRKRALARQAIGQIWPSDIPKDVPNPQILNEVGVGSTTIGSERNCKSLILALTLSYGLLVGRNEGIKGIAQQCLVCFVIVGA